MTKKRYEVVFITAEHSTRSTINNYKIMSLILTNFVQVYVTLDLLMQMLTFQNQVAFLFCRC